MPKTLRALCFGAALTWTSVAFAGECRLSSLGTLPAEMMNDRATTVVKIDGHDTRFILDTGAWFSHMSLANADALGLKREPLPMGFYESGIGGSYRPEVTTVRDFGILGVTLHNIDFTVGGSDPGMGLIGANFLDALDLDIDLAQGKLHLMKPGGDCHKTSLGWWAKDGVYQTADLDPSSRSNDRRSFVTVTINGKPFRAALDTGATATVLSRHAAERAGIDLDAPSVKASYATSGLGAKSYKTWIAPIDIFTVGTETIQHSRMQVMDGNIGEGAEAPDMLLGVDFFLAHHMFIANSQHRIYFTYNGGRVFSLAQAPKGSDVQDVAAAGALDTPVTAADYALRGQSHLSRGEPNAALADLDKAIGMAAVGTGAPRPDWYAARAHTHLALKQSDAARADLDKAIALDPGNVGNLLLRAHLKLLAKDKAGAETDIAAARQAAPAGSQQSRAVAQFYMAADRPAEALPLLDAWIRLHDDDSGLGEVLNSRCWARGLANVMLDKALPDCRKAIRRDGANPAYLDSLALIQLRQKDYAGAIANYRQAVAGNPRSAWSRYGLGLAELRGGQADAGNADLAAAKLLNSDIAARFAQFGI